jgi:hypothetical protein
MSNRRYNASVPHLQDLSTPHENSTSDKVVNPYLNMWKCGCAMRRDGPIFGQRGLLTAEKRCMNPSPYGMADGVEGFCSRCTGVLNSRLAAGGGGWNLESRTMRYGVLLEQQK